ncbi:uncharacterized protein [Onthophagus taurus]|uniref:uncharacterized protein n=1 Tax=Onthophagus taurus TaxID=166361 RepID=UPI0039BE6DF6
MVTNLNISIYLNRSLQKCFTKYNFKRCLTLSSTIRNKSCDIDTFMSSLPMIFNNICNHFKNELYGLDREAMEYNLLLGKKICGLSVIRNYEVLEDSEKLTQRNLNLAYNLGWCAEFNHTALLMENDILENSTRRSNVLCWHKLKGVNKSTSDFAIINALIYHLLKQHFSNSPNYTKMIELVRDITYKALNGQTLYTMMTVGKSNLTDFTMKKYQIITKYKTTYPMMILPFFLASYLTDKGEPDLFKELNNIFFKLGECYYIENDFNNYYGENGNDQNGAIKEGKCTWLIVKALEKANFDQKMILMKNYGKKHDDSVKRVKEIYETLNIFNDYKEQNEELRMFINDNFELISKHTCCDLMFDFSSQ